MSLIDLLQGSYNEDVVIKGNNIKCWELLLAIVVIHCVLQFWSSVAVLSTTEMQNFNQLFIFDKTLICVEICKISMIVFKILFISN